jgi:glycosyltransferase involved in cell wall biosynthesis
MTSSRRVLHVIRIARVGGAENHLRALIPELRARGWESDLLIPSPRPEAIRELVSTFVPMCGSTIVTRMRFDASPPLLVRLARLMRSDAYDVVHTHLVHADWHAAVASLAAPETTLVSSKHNADPFRTLRLFNLLERPLTNRSSAVIAISDTVRDFTLHWARPRPPVITVRYGLRAPAGGPAPRGEAEVPTLLAVGRLVPQKGLDMLIEARRDVTAAVPRARLLVAGEGPARSELEELIRQRGLDSSIELAGHCDDVPALMRSAWLLVHAARWEGFGLIFLEAMRERLPIVATAVGPIPEIVLDGVTGRLVPGEDPAALARAIVEALCEDGFRHRAGEAGFSRLVESFSAARMAEETIEVYEQALHDR